MPYHPGERVVLDHTDDPHTSLRPGDEGTVVRHDEVTQTVAIRWDSGSRLAMCLDAGDRIHRLAGDPGAGGEALHRGAGPAGRGAGAVRRIRRDVGERHDAQP